MENIEEHLNKRLLEPKFDEIHELNSQILQNDAYKSQVIVEKMLKENKLKFQKNRVDLTPSITSPSIQIGENSMQLPFEFSLDSVQQLGKFSEKLDKRLQDHIRMLKHNEGSLSGTNTVLAYDSAKAKTDKLVEIIRAKLLWKNTYKDLQESDKSDQNELYRKLVLLQKSFEILSKYSINREWEANLEKMKDEFLSWFTSAILFAIEENDTKQLDSLKEKFTTLNRIAVFEQSFAAYAKNKIKSFIGDGEKTDHTVWSILHEIFGIWKRCRKLANSFLGENGSSLISDSLYDGVVSKWDIVLNVILGLMNSAETPIAAAREISTIRNDFLSYVEKDGDEYLLKVTRKICYKIFDVMSEGYAKHVTSMLLCTVNKITAPERTSRSRHNWLMPHLDELKSAMFQMVDDASLIFGPGFSIRIVPAFDCSIKEMNFLIRNQDILGIRRDVGEINTRKTIQENAEDKISAICVTGYLLNLIDHINNYIVQVHSDFEIEKDESETEAKQITNRNLVERLNKKVVEYKAESIANTIIYGMSEEMNLLKTSTIESELVKISLPSFSIPPHNYITTVGHGLLNQMNTISSFASDKNFATAIASAANNSEEEADLWLLNAIGVRVMNAFCANVGELTQLNQKLARQFNADVSFLMEALIDLRLHATPELLSLSNKLKEISSTN